MPLGAEQHIVYEGCNRSLDGVISQHERQLLESLARRLPQFVTPDQLTILGVTGSAIAALALIASGLSLDFLWLAIVGLAINWAGDSLDGTLARVRRIERPRYGFFVDHMSDLASQFLIVLGLGLSPLMRFDIATLALVGYLALSVYTFVKLHVTRNMQLSYFGVGPTEIRVLIGAGLVCGALFGVVHFDSPMGVMTPIDAFALLLVAFAMVSAAGMFVRDARQLALIDPALTTPPTEVRMIEITRSGAEAMLGAARREA